MQHNSAWLALRVPPSLPEAVAAVARAEGIGKSEFTRRALATALVDRSADRAA